MSSARELSSCQNSSVRELRKVLKNPEEYPCVCVVEGLRASKAFATSPYYALEQWFATRKMYENLPDFIDKEYVTIVSDDIMCSLSRAKTPSGLLGHFVGKPTSPKLSDYATFVLYNISDPGNAGTIIRTAVALGRKRIIMINGCHHSSYKVIQASAGMIAYIQVIRCSWDDFMNHRDIKIPLYALDAQGELLQNISDNELASCYFLIGNEAHGLPENIQSQADRLIALPMNTICESLNASVAAALVGYRAWSKI